ncbi:hypothetical protein H4R26_000174 [Coemansia thaxteri]|uniref:C2H2-type domain-containing protein n=1 Tax=Coemansia thaxteri TaxID=2663907 RepID=A0A9W8BN61_9FUNG|nr:hypothetical protein H4R26_000174 [Coemansia thaxteri]
MDLAGFLANAPSLFGEDEVQGEEIEPDILHGTHAGAIRRFRFDNGDSLSCVRWDERFHITSTDIIRALVHRFQDIRRPVVNIKKFEEGVFSDLRSLKPGVHARLELPRSEFLDLLFKHHCVRTQKKQKVFYWDSVPHDVLFREALERDLKREAMGMDTTTKISKDADPAAHVVIGGIELPLSVPPTLAVHMHVSSVTAGAAPPAPRVSNVLVSSAPIPAAATSSKPLSLALTAPVATNGLQLSQGAKASAVSIASMASSSHDEDLTDARFCVYPDSRGRHGDSADALSFASHGACGPKQQRQPIASASDTVSTQPSLNEYISEKLASSSSTPLNIMGIGNNWTGMDFQALHKQASDLRAIYDEHQPTPTPHHSPKEGIANGPELLELLSGDPNALVTDENVGDFNALLEQLLSGGVAGGQTQEGALGSATSASFGFEGTLPRQQMDMAGDNTPVAPATIESMKSSPSIASLLSNSQRISPNHTPEIVMSLQFRGGEGLYGANGSMPFSDIGSMMVSSAHSPEGAQALSAISSGIHAMPMDSLLPMFSPSPGCGVGNESESVLAQQSSFAESLAEARLSAEDPRSNEFFRQAWQIQKPPVNNLPTPRSSRFSRFHPYLKTMARIAHRDSPTIINRLPSTADPTVAAAAVNAMAAKINRQDEASEQQQQQAWSMAFSCEQPSAQSGEYAHAYATGTYSAAAALADSSGFRTEHNMDLLSIKEETADSADGRKDKGGDPAGEQRRYTCTFIGCVKQFKRHEHLKRHFRTHTGERPYKCPAPECPKVFARMDNLNQHIRTHVNRKTATRRISGSSGAFLETAGQQQPIQGGGMAGFIDDSANMPPPMQQQFLNGSAMFPAVGGAAAAAIEEPQRNAASGDEDLSFREQAPFGATTAFGSQASAHSMRISMPEELSLMGREWFISNSSSSGTPQPPPPPVSLSVQPMQSPLMENNTVTFLRKLSKNNRQRSIGATPVGTRGGREEQLSPIGGLDPQQQVMPSRDMGLARTPSSDTSSINPVWLASFLAQAQQNQLLETLSRGDGQRLNGFTAPGQQIHETVGISRVLSLKRHLDEFGDGLTDDDVVMAGSGTSSRGAGSHRSHSASGDEHQMPRSAATAAGASAKFVRASISSKHHVSTS